MVQAQSIRKQKQELRNFLRNSDIISTTIRGVTTTTDDFNGTGSQTDFILTGTGVKNIRSVIVDSVTLTYGKDYNIEEDDDAITTLTFTIAPDSGTDNVNIEYDYGLTDKIFDDFPQDFITINAFPRIGFDIISSPTRAIAFSGSAFQSNKLVQVNVYSKDTDEVELFLDNIRQLILNNSKSFHYWNFIMPDNLGPMLPSDVKGGKIFQRNIDLRAEFEFEGTDC